MMKMYKISALSIVFPAIKLCRTHVSNYFFRPIANGVLILTAVNVNGTSENAFITILISVSFADTALFALFRRAPKSELLEAPNLRWHFRASEFSTLCQIEITLSIFSPIIATLCGLLVGVASGLFSVEI